MYLCVYRVDDKETSNLTETALARFYFAVPLPPANFIIHSHRASIREPSRVEVEFCLAFTSAATVAALQLLYSY